MYLALFFILGFSSNLFAITPHVFIDGKVTYAVADVNGKICWTGKEKQDAIDHHNTNITSYTLVITNIIPTKFEINVATCSGKFSNHTDFVNSLSNKDALFEKIRTLKADYDLAVFLGDTNKIIDILQKLNALKEVYKSLM